MRPADFAVLDEALGGSGLIRAVGNLCDRMEIADEEVRAAVARYDDEADQKAANLAFAVLDPPEILLSKPDALYLAWARQTIENVVELARKDGRRRKQARLFEDPPAAGSVAYDEWKAELERKFPATRVEAMLALSAQSLLAPLPSAMRHAYAILFVEVFEDNPAAASTLESTVPILPSTEYDEEEAAAEIERWIKKLS